MLAPAALYLLHRRRTRDPLGWGVPMATDIAFAVGILTLLGDARPARRCACCCSRSPSSTTSGAIVVIALFYSSGVRLSGLLGRAAGLAGIFAMQRLGVRTKLAYICAGASWRGPGIYAAGIHPTIAGVIVGLMTPVRAWLGPERLRQRCPQRARPSRGRDADPSSLPHELAEHATPGRARAP